MTKPEQATAEAPASPADLNGSMTTDRLELVPLRSDHAEELFSVLADLSLYEYTHEVPPPSQLALRIRYRMLETRRSPDGKEGWLNWVLVERGTGMAIGYVQATVKAGTADVAWVVGTLWQRRGFASEAAQALVLKLRSAGVTAIRAHIHPLHTASQRVAENAGFSRTVEIAGGEEVWSWRE